MATTLSPETQRRASCAAGPLRSLAS